MNAIADAERALWDALSQVAGVHVQPDFGPAVDPPAVVLGPPALVWESGCLGPSSAQWRVYVVVTADEKSAQRLYELVPAVADALDGVRQAAVTRADPGRWPNSTGTGDLPTYEITVEVAL